MSLYQFISCDHQLPELIRMNNCLLSENPLSELSEEVDAIDLEIRKNDDLIPFQVPHYSSLHNIYTIDWQYTDNNCRKLLDYLSSVHSPWEIEIWSVWLCNDEYLPRELSKLKVLQHDHKDVNYDLLKSIMQHEDNENLPVVLKLFSHHY